MNPAPERSGLPQAVGGMMLAVLLAGCAAGGLQAPLFSASRQATAGATPLAMSEPSGNEPARSAAAAADAAAPSASTDPAASREREDDGFSLAALRRKIDAAFTPEKPPADKRQQLGDALARKVLENTRLVEDAGLRQRLDGIVQRLAAPARRESGFPARWRLYIIESPRADAFTSGGGHLFITRGMIDLLGSDERIATVLAHEMAHNLLAHVWSAREKKELARKAHRFSREVLAGQMKMPWLGKSVWFLVRTSLNTYSRQQEYDADALGLHLLVRAGYRPQAALETFDYLSRRFREESGLKNFFYSHHPLYERRRWYIANRIRAYYRREAGLPPVRRANWK